MRYLYCFFILVFILLSCGPDRGSGKSNGKKPQKAEQTKEAKTPELSENDSIVAAEMALFEERMDDKNFRFETVVDCRPGDYSHQHGENSFPIRKPFDVQVYQEGDLYVKFKWIDHCCLKFVADENMNIKDRYGIRFWSVGNEACKCECLYEFEYSVLWSHEFTREVFINGFSVGKPKSRYADDSLIQYLKTVDYRVDEFMKVQNYQIEDLGNEIETVHVMLSDFATSEMEILFVLKNGKVTDQFDIANYGDIPQDLEEEEYIKAEIIDKRKIKQTITTVFPASGKDDVEDIKWFEINKEGEIVEVEK